jgi:CDP-diacylglycerol--serine O-phosphatidyltransferase
VPRPRRKGIYVLPNAITLAALFSGFYGIVMAMNGRFEAACIAIFVRGGAGQPGRPRGAHDQLAERLRRADGQPVRHGQLRRRAGAHRLRVGAQGLGKMGWIPAFVYIAGAALRLARFNTNIGIVDKRFFQGLPSPAAAAW